MNFTTNFNSLVDDNDIQIDGIKLQKMLILFNAIEDGWAIKKKQDSYVFTKKHEGKREILHESYLLTFMKTNLDINKVLLR
jgi:hypothetical protein|uniref:Uncharacterized protein n=1 Tax=viral metagenome TaxID=1070528 RepID=A0A6C0E6G1_9ZZZZ